MKEIYGDLWELECDARCITTNGYVTKDGRAVMGRGCALEAKEKWPGIDRYLGELIQKQGNLVFSLGTLEEGGPLLLTFPVKWHWKHKANINLIENSASQLMSAVEFFDLKKVLLPRPGCGNGQLDWGEVCPVIEKILDDRVYVVTWM